MNYRGRVKNGVIVFDEPLSLPEGTQVIVQLAASVSPQSGEDKQNPPPAADKPRKKLAERFKGSIGSISDLPPDFSENHDHYIHGTPKK